jgi:hypothetical protein
MTQDFRHKTGAQRVDMRIEVAQGTQVLKYQMDL